MPNQNIIAELSWRGLIQQMTEETEIAKSLSERSLTLYAGFDPTADSLHVGSLLPLLGLRRFQQAGHRPIALIGGATGMIGDPSGKSKERSLLSIDELRFNQAGIERQIRSLLRSDGPQGAVVVNNLDWMSGLHFLDFLRDVGKHFPVNVMLAKDSVSARLERDDTGISYTEFSYMLLQAYDFVHLHRNSGCELQIGGSDQWGNITAGIDLARRMHGASLYGLTLPLLLNSEGQKMGKTERGTIWLARERTSPYLFYQYWMQVADVDAGRCLRFLTDLTREEIESLDVARTSAPHLRASQRRLAECLTEIVHGADELASAERASEILFGGEVSDLTDSQLLEIFSDVPSQTMPAQTLASGLGLIDALVAGGLAKSKGEARRIIEQGGAYINNRRCGETTRVLTASDLATESVIVLRAGKQKYALLRFQTSN